MNAAVTVGLGKAVGAVVLIGPDIPIREHLRSVKRKEVEVPPGVDVVEVWSRNTGVLKRRKIRSVAEPVHPAAVENEVSPDTPAVEADEDSPVAEAVPKKAAKKKK